LRCLRSKVYFSRFKSETPIVRAARHGEKTAGASWCRAPYRRWEARHHQSKMTLKISACGQVPCPAPCFNLRGKVGNKYQGGPCWRTAHKASPGLVASVLRRDGVAATSNLEKSGNLLPIFALVGAGKGSLLDFSAPELLELCRVDGRVLDGVLNVPMSQIILNEPRISALVGQGEPASVAQHVRMSEQGQGSRGAVLPQRELKVCSSSTRPAESRSCPSSRKSACRETARPPGGWA
jgi:hypothetical protein